MIIDIYVHALVAWHVEILIYVCHRSTKRKDDVAAHLPSNEAIAFVPVGMAFLLGSMHLMPRAIMASDVSPLNTSNCSNFMAQDMCDSKWVYRSYDVMLY